MIETAERPTTIEHQQVLDEWCSDDVLRRIAAFVERTLGTRGKS